MDGRCRTCHSKGPCVCERVCASVCVHVHVPVPRVGTLCAGAAGTRRPPPGPTAGGRCHTSAGHGLQLCDPGHGPERRAGRPPAVGKGLCRVPVTQGVSSTGHGSPCHCGFGTLEGGGGGSLRAGRRPRGPVSCPPLCRDCPGGQRRAPAAPWEQTDGRPRTSPRHSAWRAATVSGPALCVGRLHRLRFRLVWVRRPGLRRRGLHSPSSLQLHPSRSPKPPGLAGLWEHEAAPVACGAGAPRPGRDAASRVWPSASRWRSDAASYPSLRSPSLTRARRHQLQMDGRTPCRYQLAHVLCVFTKPETLSATCWIWHTTPFL